MRRPAVHALILIALAAGLAGCGGTSAQPATTTAAAPPPPVTTTQATTTRPAPTLTSPADVAACAQVEGYIRIVSQVVSNSVESMTQSLHPKQLARRTKQAEKNLLASARFLTQLELPKPLVKPQQRLAAGLRAFAADFARAEKSVARNDMEKAARQLVDRPALAKVTGATRAIDRACGG